MMLRQKELISLRHDSHQGQSRGVLHRRGARSTGSTSRGNEITIALDHIDLLYGQAGLIGQVLRINSFMPLPSRLCAHIKVNAAIGLKHNPGGLGRVAQNTFDIAAKPQAAQQTLFCTCSAPRREVFECGLLGQTVQHKTEIPNVVAHLAGCLIGKFFRPDEVTTAKLPSVYAQLTGRIIHSPFQNINRLRTSRTPIGIHLRCIGVNPSHLQMRDRNIVKTGQDF